MRFLLLNMLSQMEISRLGFSFTAVYVLQTPLMQNSDSLCISRLTILINAAILLQFCSSTVTALILKAALWISTHAACFAHLTVWTADVLHKLLLTFLLHEVTSNQKSNANANDLKLNINTFSSHPVVSRGFVHVTYCIFDLKMSDRQKINCSSCVTDIP